MPDTTPFFDLIYDLDDRQLKALIIHHWKNALVVTRASVKSWRWANGVGVSD